MMPDFSIAGDTRGARNIHIPILLRPPQLTGLQKDIAVSASFWPGSHGVRTLIEVSVRLTTTSHVDAVDSFPFSQ